MNSDGVYLIDYASFEESEYINKNTEISLNKAKYVVNPKYRHLINKIIIINLPVEVPIERLLKYNKIISRFPTAIGVDIDPYDLPQNRESIENKEFSLLILNKDMLLDVNKLDLVTKNNFLLGIDTEVDGYITLAGYILLKNKLENFTKNI